MEPLTGDALLEVVKQNVDASKQDLLEKTGYTSKSADGKTSFHQQQFYKALVEAQGISLDAFTKPSGGGTGGRKLPYKTTVQKNGSIVVGRGYFVKHEYQPGQVFKVETKPGAIKLTPVKKES